MKICSQCFKDMFTGRDYLYFITIKPPPDEKFHDKMYDLSAYLLKRDIVHWITKSCSESGYVHYHGVLSFNESQTLNNNKLKAIQRKVNRDMGFLTIEPLKCNSMDIYRYARASRNTNNGKYAQRDFFITAPSHCLIEAINKDVDIDK